MLLVEAIGGQRYNLVLLNTTFCFDKNEFEYCCVENVLLAWMGVVMIFKFFVGVVEKVLL
jgi:hypothetical protein